MTFHLKPFSFKHTGLFPEQAANWDWFGDKIRKAGTTDQGSESLCLHRWCNPGGGSRRSIRYTRRCLQRNGYLGERKCGSKSGLADAPIRWLVDDCVKFVEREIRRGNHYDAIIMDPPSYGRGPKGEIWKIEDAIHPLVKLCTKILSDDPLFFLINSYTTGLAPAVLTYMLATETEEV